MGERVDYTYVSKNNLLIVQSQADNANFINMLIQGITEFNVQHFIIVLHTWAVYM